jgi:hypothetical protein
VVPALYGLHIFSINKSEKSFRNLLYEFLKNAIHIFVAEIYNTDKLPFSFSVLGVSISNTGFHKQTR